MRPRRALHLIHGWRPAHVRRVLFGQLRRLSSGWLRLLQADGLPELPGLLHVRSRFINAFLQGGFLIHQFQLLLLLRLLKTAFVVLDGVLFLVGVGDEGVVDVEIERFLLDKLILHEVLRFLRMGGLRHFAALS